MEAEDSKYFFIEEWDETTSIEWRNVGRKKLNKIIRRFNKWQRKHDFDEIKKIKLLTRIEEGKQTFASRDGGSGWWEDLDRMETFVKHGIKREEGIL